ncbi:MAG TPA: TolC family protein [Polyangia bacterium]|nr:TolC family protein [Polyangia bacterium]
MTPLAIALPALSLLLANATDPTNEAAVFAERLHAETNVAGGLTAEVAARRAEARSGDVEARRADVDAAAAAVDQALVAYFPRLAASARYTRLSAIDPPLLGVLVGADAPAGPLPAGTQLVNVPIKLPIELNQTSFQAQLAVPLSDYVFRIGQSHAAASHSEEAARHAEEAARRKARAEAKTLYYEWTRAKLSRVVADAAVAQASGHLEDARHAFEAGSASKADVLRVEAQLAAADQVAVRARTLTTALEARLRTMMHAPANEALAIGEPVDVDFVASSGARDLEVLAADAERARPEVRAVDSTIGALDQQARAVRNAAAPSLAVIGEVTDANPNLRYVPAPDAFETTWSVTAQLAWSPNDAFSAAKAGRGVAARRDAARGQRTALLDGVRSEIAGALQAVDESASAQQTSARAVAAAEESYRVRRSLFQNGRATSVELTDAETELTRARLDLVAARIAARVANVQLARATGADAN